MSAPGSDLFGHAPTRDTKSPVECLGMTFQNDEGRREHFLGILREKLKDPEFRNTPGFPKGSDEDILRLSDPPYYTACPNPFLEDFVRCYGKPYDPAEPYHREPFAVDVSEGKTDALYKAHGYHTKVPHLAIVPSILHYTKPGDIVLDGFCGSGMTGVAAQWCGAAPADYRHKLEQEWREAGLGKPEWGARRAILGDLSPAATFIAANYNLPFDVSAFEKAAKRILKEVNDEIGWMYETLHTDGKTKGRINFTVWSEVFACPDCSGELVFLEEALDSESKRVKDEFACPHCGAGLSKKRLERFYEVKYDAATGQNWRLPKRLPVLIQYNVGRQGFEKQPDSDDLLTIQRIQQKPLPSDVPTDPLPYMHMTHERARMDMAGITHIHHFFLPRQAQALGLFWKKARTEKDPGVSRALEALVHHQIVNGSIMNRYRPASSFGNAPLGGVYYVSSLIAEASILKLVEGTVRRFQRMMVPGWRDLQSLNQTGKSPGSAGETVEV